jgi:integral membrane protein
MAETASGPPPSGDYVDFDDPAASLRRKIAITKVMAVVECISYGVLLVPMSRKYIFDVTAHSNYVALRLIAYFHGIICVAFAVMILDIFRVMKWKWWFVLLTFAGPPGAFIAHRRLTRQPAPAVVDRNLMVF